MFKWREEKEKGFRDWHTLDPEKTKGGKQDAFCLEVARLTVKQKATLNLCVAFLRAPHH